MFINTVKGGYRTRFLSGYGTCLFGFLNLLLNPESTMEKLDSAGRRRRRPRPNQSGR